MRNFSVKLFLTVLALLAAAAARGEGDVEWLIPGPDGQQQIVLWYFYSDSCPHCQDAKPFVEELGERDWIELRAYEVTGNRDHGRLYRDTARAVGEQARSVPAFIFCGSMQTGFDSAEVTGAVLLARLEHCRANPDEVIASFAGAGDESAGPRPGEVMGVQAPLLGVIDPEEWGLPLLTVVVAGLDAFNPCAFFVLLFLLSLMVHARSRSRMLLVGGTFVLISGVIYFIFMAAWLNVFLILGELRMVTIVAGFIAVVLASINIREYFLFGEGGPSLSIPESKKPGMYRRMRNLVGTKNVWAMLIGTIILAVAVNSYELLCTAGLPMVYTRILTLRETDTFVYYLYLLLYNIIYIIPLLVIVCVFVFKLGSRKLGETEGRLLKLLSGMMMLALGLLLLIAPTALNNPGIAIGLLLAAVALTWVIHFFSRRAGLV